MTEARTSSSVRVLYEMHYIPTAHGKAAPGLKEPNETLCGIFLPDLYMLPAQGDERQCIKCHQIWQQTVQVNKFIKDLERLMK